MRVSAISGIGLAVWIAAAAVASEGASRVSLVSLHSAGLDAVSKHPDLNPVARILALRPSQDLVRQVTFKVSQALPMVLGGASQGDAAVSRTLERWVDRACRGELHIEVDEVENGSVEWGMGVRLEGDEATVLAKDLGVALDTILGAEVARKDVPEGWQWEGKRGSVRLAVVPGWLVLGGGSGAVETIVGRVQRGASGEDAGAAHSLRVRADLGRLATRLGWGEAPPGPVAAWPVVAWTMTPRRGGFRSDGRLEFKEPLGLALEPWRLPTAWVRDPLVGFTAIQGADRWLRRTRLGEGMETAEWPRQVFLWSIVSQPWLQYAAAPVADPSGFVSRLSSGPLFASATNWLGSRLPVSLWTTNEPARMEWRGLPFLAPFVAASGQGDGAAVVAGLFPLATLPTPAPEELFAQVTGRTNLLAYDWETTGRLVVLTNVTTQLLQRATTNRIGRLAQLSQLQQFMRMVSAEPAGAAGPVAVPGLKWIEAAIPELGDTITEVSVSGPTELSVTRQSRLGFNSWELLALLRWVENPGFPGWARGADGPVASPRTTPSL